MSEETTNQDSGDAPQEGIVLTLEEQFLQDQLKAMRKARAREQAEIVASLQQTTSET
jgi:hypothetical protein